MARKTDVIWIDDNTLQYQGSVKSGTGKDPNLITFTIDLTGYTRKEAAEGDFGGTNRRIARANWLRDNKTQAELEALARTGVKGRWDDQFEKAGKEVTPEKAVVTILNLNKGDFMDSMRKIGFTHEECLKAWDKKVQSVLKREN